MITVSPTLKVRASMIVKDSVVKVSYGITDYIKDVIEKVYARDLFSRD
jgi:hypothetical protein